MATNIYRITMKSMEQRGATTPNIVELAFASEDDANTFGANMENVCSARNVSNDNMVSTNYVLPYPIGTDAMVRCSLTDGTGLWQTIRVYDVPADFVPSTRTAALIAAGFLLDVDGTVPTTANATVFRPGPSV